MPYPHRPAPAAGHCGDRTASASLFVFVLTKQYIHAIPQRRQPYVTAGSTGSRTRFVGRPGSTASGLTHAGGGTPCPAAVPQLSRNRRTATASSWNFLKANAVGEMRHNL